MTLSPLQTAQNNWMRRAAQFRSQGIPDTMWKSLYNRDMEGVYSGSQGMSDAEVYAGVQSAVHGPQIQDPKPQTGHGSGIMGVLDTAANVVGNVPHDIAGVITGFIPGIAHVIAHAPSELTNTANLIGHLASGDNNWLRQQGYIGKNESVNASWSGFATLLRAMDAKGSQQLLPYIPGLADLAELTNGQGRQILMQHPVGALLDILPGVAKGGKLAMAGRDFSQIADEASLAKMGVDGTPKFYAAGAALQKGNPIKAAVSAVGDVIPAGKDQFGASMTLRQRSNLMAQSMGIDRWLREGVIRPAQNMRDELEAQASRYLKESFGDTMFMQASPERLHYMYLGTHGINPETGQVFKSVDEFNTWRDTQLSPEENAAVNRAKQIVDLQEKQDMKTGMRAAIPSPGGEWKDMYSHRSPVTKAWNRITTLNDQIAEAANEGDANKVASLYSKLDEARQTFAKVRFTEIPEAWTPAVAQHVRNNMLKEADALMTGQELANAKIQINSSIYADDMIRVFGKEKYQAFVNDALNWWKSMAEAGFYPLWTQHVDPDAVGQIMHPPLGQIDQPVEPSRFRPKAVGINFAQSVQNIAVSLTASQVEVMRYAMLNEFLKNEIVPRHTVSKLAKIKEYTAAVQRNNPTASPTMVRERVMKLIGENFDDFNPKEFGLRKVDLGLRPGQPAVLLDKNVSKAIRAMMSPEPFSQWGGKWVHRGTSLYKFSVLTGPRHLAHVGIGGLMFMMLREPLAPLQFASAARILRGTATLEDHGMAGKAMAGGLRGRVYEIGTHHAWNYAAGARFGEDVATDLIHQAKQAGVKAAEFIPNKMARLEETVMDMYRVSSFLSARKRGLTTEAALETARKVFVDINGMSLMERTLVKQLFPFYAFTRHLFRYLFTYPVDYPVRAAIVQQFAEMEQADWKSGLPRSYMSLLWLGQPDKNGNIAAVDTKNINPFRSFANDFTFAGFFSSLSPFLTAPLAAIGVDTLSGTTQLYPGTTYNPTTGSLQATPPPGGLWSLGESFVPQIGLLDHYLGLTQSTRLLAKFSPLSYQKQLYNMLNVPFVPQVVNVPYQQEITEMRRFRAAQAAVTIVEKSPTAANIAKLMEWNTVPFNNELIPPAVLAHYYQRIKTALDAAGKGYIAPKSAIMPPVRRPARLSSF